MPKEEGTTFCYLCGGKLTFAPLLANEQLGMWCVDPSCPRFGLLTVISTPQGKVEKFDEENLKQS